MNVTTLFFKSGPGNGSAGLAARASDQNHVRF
jgi:hypothetical protein